MKKIFVSLCALALVCGSAIAQDEKSDSFLFNHLGLGVTLGFDGAGAEIVLPVGHHMQIRGGYSMVPYTYTSKSVHVEIDKATSSSPWDINGDIAAKVHPVTDGARLLLDLYPSKKGGFHFTVGAYYGIHPDRGVFAITTAEPLPIPESEWGTTGIELKRGEDPSVYLSTDREGYFKMDLRMDNPIGNKLGVPTLRPYAGIGFGRNLKADGSIAFTLDLGALYCGSWGVYGWDYMSDLDSDGIPVKLQKSDVAAVEEVFDLEQGTITRYSDKAFDIMGALPVAPILKFNLVIKLF
ncbi:MAG: hypothetical protein IJ799_05560 [Bacteroidales bacterium]|nr:hypothetical protein [Bacteroidales bacterium]